MLTQEQWLALLDRVDIDADAANSFVTQSYALARRYLQHLGFTSRTLGANLEDVARDAAKHVWRVRKRYDRTKGFESWANTAFLNFARSEVRRHKREKGRAALFTDLPSTSQNLPICEHRHRSLDILRVEEPLHELQNSEEAQLVALSETPSTLVSFIERGQGALSKLADFIGIDRSTIWRHGQDARRRSAMERQQRAGTTLERAQAYLEDAMAPEEYLREEFGDLWLEEALACHLWLTDCSDEGAQTRWQAILSALVSSISTHFCISDSEIPEKLNRMRSALREDNVSRLHVNALLSHTAQLWLERDDDAHIYCHQVRDRESDCAATIVTIKDCAILLYIACRQLPRTLPSRRRSDAEPMRAVLIRLPPPGRTKGAGRPASWLDAQLKDWSMLPNTIQRFREVNGNKPDWSGFLSLLQK